MEPFDDSHEAGQPAVYAVDTSVWPRCDAESSRTRLLLPCLPPLRRAAIVAGWAYQLVARLSFARDSWVAPADARRVRPDEDANDVAAGQMKDLVRCFPGRHVAPLFIFDAGYDPVHLQKQLEECPAQILVRLHSGRTFYSDPPTLERRPVGRPFVHGSKFDFKDSGTWHKPATEHRSEDAGYGKVRVRGQVGTAPQDPASGRTLR